MPRLFVAIDFPDTVKTQILRLRQDDLPPGRWSRRAALHLTLHFIGGVPEAVANAYEAVLHQVDAPGFELRIAGVGQFPTESRPRIIWAGVENRPPLRALHEAIGQALEREGFQREKRPYHPHITLMRFRKPLRRGPASRWIKRHLDFYTDALPVTQFILYESELTAEGPMYTKRRVYDLRPIGFGKIETAPL